MIAVIDYNAGNIASIKNALKKLGFDYIVTSSPDDVEIADKIIFPGVGRAGVAMAELKKRGLDEIIEKVKAPFLGICLGMQLLADKSEEDKTDCLTVISGQVNKFSNALKVPQIGWNSIEFSQDSLLFKNIPNQSFFYFVNSYYFDTDKKFIVGKTSYGIDFPSAVQKDNFYGVQFHPEKSGEIGLKVLKNFCDL
ncbi:MAG: imidazole glycerol phosphate synthase subunit HisH [bacterium]